MTKQQVNTLMGLIDTYAETRHRCGGRYNSRTETARKAVIAALNAAAATKDSTGVPFQAIKALLDQAMTQAVANGANSLSMPDEIVEVAHWLTFSDMWRQEADSQPTQDAWKKWQDNTRS